MTLECRDLEGEPWPWEAERFAGIVVTNYLHRPHFPYYWDSLMPGGVLIMETFTEANMMIWEHPRNPDHYLTEGELIRLAPADARVVAYEEGLTQDIVGRPAVGGLRTAETFFRGAIPDGAFPACVRRTVPHWFL